MIKEKSDFLLTPTRTTLNKYVGSESEIIIPASVKKIKADAFSGSKITKISFEKNSYYEKFEADSFKIGSLKMIDFSNSLVNSISENFIIETKSKIKLIGISRYYITNLEDEKTAEHNEGKCIVNVGFEDGNAYKYACVFPIKEGDVVKIEGTRAAELGIVRNIEPFFNITEYELLNVVEIVRKPDKKIKKALDEMVLQKPKKEVRIYTKDYTKNACVSVRTNNDYILCNCFADIEVNDKVSVLMDENTIVDGVVDAIREKPMNGEYIETKYISENNEEIAKIITGEKIVAFIPQVVRINKNELLDKKKLEEKIKDIKKRKTNNEKIVSDRYRNEFEMTNREESRPLLLNDDYPFGYTINKPLNLLINKARIGEKTAIEKLISIYEVSLLEDDAKTKSLKDRQIEEFAWLSGSATEKKKIGYWKNKLATVADAPAVRNYCDCFENKIEIKAGEKIQFGRYFKIPLLWTVLDVKERGILIMCDYSLMACADLLVESKQLEDMRSLKELNNVLLCNIFSESEKSMICHYSDIQMEENGDYLENKFPFDLRILTYHEYGKYKSIIPSNLDWAIACTNDDVFYDRRYEITDACIESVSECGSLKARSINKIIGLRPVMQLRRWK